MAKRPVVAGFDGSDAGEDALSLATNFARALDVPLVVAVVHPAGGPPGMGRDAEWVTALRAEADHVAERARKLLDGRAPAQFRLVGSSSAARGLVELAEEEGATAVVVGSGRGGALRRTAAGSTAERLLHGSGVAVMVAPRGWRESHSGDRLETVGCAFLDTPDGREALRVAADLAAHTGARLRVYSVVAPVSEFSPTVGLDAERAFAERAQAQYAAALESAVATLPEGMAVSAELLEGDDPVDSLAALDDRDVDLLVCGSRGYGPLRSVLLGGTSSRLVRRAAAPLLVVPRRADARSTDAQSTPKERAV